MAYESFLADVITRETDAVDVDIRDPQAWGTSLVKSELAGYMGRAR